MQFFPGGEFRAGLREFQFIKKVKAGFNLWRGADRGQLGGLVWRRGMEPRCDAGPGSQQQHSGSDGADSHHFFGLLARIRISKLIFTRSFTFTVPPATFTGVMPWSVWSRETSPCARNPSPSLRRRNGKLTAFSTPRRFSLPTSLCSAPSAAFLVARTHAYVYAISGYCTTH